MRYYIVYQTTCLVNGKIYVGQHQTDDIHDGYLGSGKNLRKAIIKYGKDSFVREVIAIFDNKTAMNDLEILLVNESFINRPDTYNMVVGGRESNVGIEYWNSIRTDDHPSEILRRDKIRDYNIKNNITIPKNPNQSEASKKGAITRNKKVADGVLVNPWVGRSHSKETLSKMKQVHHDNKHQSGNKNSQYGTRWIYHPELGNRKISKNDIIPEGWTAGRKL